MDSSRVGTTSSRREPWKKEALILRLGRLKRPHSADEIAVLLHCSPKTALAFLEELEKEGVLAATAERRGSRGPATPVFSLTETGSAIAERLSETRPKETCQVTELGEVRRATYRYVMLTTGLELDELFFDWGYGPYPIDVIRRADGPDLLFATNLHPEALGGAEELTARASVLLLEWNGLVILDESDEAIASRLLISAACSGRGAMNLILIDARRREWLPTTLGRVEGWTPRSSGYTSPPGSSSRPAQSTDHTTTSGKSDQLQTWEPRHGDWICLRCCRITSSCQGGARTSFGGRRSRHWYPATLGSHSDSTIMMGRPSGCGTPSR